MRRRLNRGWRAVSRALAPCVLLGVPAVLVSGCVESQNSALLAQAAQVAVLPPRDEGITRAQKPANENIRRTVFDAVGNPFPPLKSDQGAIRIRAHVNGVPILDDEVMEASVSQLKAAPTDAQRVQVLNRALDSLIDTEIEMQDLKSHLLKLRPSYMQKLKAAANEEFQKRLASIKEATKKAGIVIKNDAEMKKFLLSQGVSMEGLRRRYEREFMTREYMRQRVWSHLEHDVTHQDIVEYYNQHSNQFQLVDLVDWQDIFIDASKYRSRQEAHDFAVQLAQRAANGESFAKLASIYGGDSIYRNGEGFGHLRGEIRPPEAEAVLFQLRPGQVGPIIEVSRGFHVIRLVRRQYQGLRPLDDKAQEDIRHKLQTEVLERESKRLLADLKSKAIIEKVPYQP
ncbi:MAG TPA: peptidyl-prolyl cis-trans isomerase [Gemmataceae bacterium]|nr:peptidyl-prolyl cis-trans isomerase [Gemmataceae bacterium]